MSGALNWDWFFAEGFTGDNFDEWLCIQNPGDDDANVTINYYPEAGTPITTNHTVNAKSRYTISVNADAGPDLMISTKLNSNVPIIVERPMYFIFNGLPGGHDVSGLMIR